MRKLPKKIQDQIRYEYPGDRFVKKTKYGNKSCTCVSKHIHQSILEANHCNYLYAQKQAGEISDFKIQYKVDLRVNGVHIANYYADFYVLDKQGNEIIEETKGMWTDVAKIKWELSKALNKHIKHVVKYAKPKFFKGTYR